MVSGVFMVFGGSLVHFFFIFSASWWILVDFFQCSSFVWSLSTNRGRVVSGLPWPFHPLGCSEVKSHEWKVRQRPWRRRRQLRSWQSKRHSRLGADYVSAHFTSKEQTTRLDVAQLYDKRLIIYMKY